MMSAQRVGNLDKGKCEFGMRYAHFRGNIARKFTAPFLHAFYG